MEHYGIPRERVFIYDFPVRRFPAHRQEILEKTKKVVYDCMPELEGVELSEDSVINTDMGIGELLDLAEQVQSIGVSTFKHIDAPVNPEDNGAGGTWSVIDQNNLGAQLGLLVSDEPQQQEDEGE